MRHFFRNIALGIIFGGILPFFLVNESAIKIVAAETQSGASRCDASAPTGAGGEYYWKVCACIKARKEGKAKSLTNPICPEWTMSEEDIAYRVILDSEFSKLDKKVYADLGELQKQRGKDFVKMNNTVHSLFDTTAGNENYSTQYATICRSFSAEGNPLRSAILAFGSVSTDVAPGNLAKCNALTNRKLSAYRAMGALFVMQNLSKTYENNRTGYIQLVRNEYVQFFRKWDSYISGLGRIKDKWNVKVKHPL